MTDNKAIAERMMFTLECFNGNKWEDDCSEEVKRDVKAMKDEYQRLDGSYTLARRQTIQHYFQKMLVEAIEEMQRELDGQNALISSLNVEKQYLYEEIQRQKSEMFSEEELVSFSTYVWNNNETIPMSKLLAQFKQERGKV